MRQERPLNLSLKENMGKNQPSILFLTTKENGKTCSVGERAGCKKSVNIMTNMDKRLAKSWNRERKHEKRDPHVHV